MDSIEKILDRGELSASIPLVVDLDGTLVRSDLLVESFFADLGADPSRLIRLSRALRNGKAAFKADIASRVMINASILPYDERVLMLIREARATGRCVYLASASNERYVASVADYLGVFDGWFASNADNNLSSHAKARRMVEIFGEKGFDYIGNDRADLAVWLVARHCIALHPSDGVRRDLLKRDPDALIVDPPGDLPRAWIKLLRVHQWAKNALVFVPVLSSQSVDFVSLVHAVGAFLTLSLAASAIYILNDLVDIEADRGHPSKKRRPLAAGTVPILQAIVIAPSLVALAIGGALAITPGFAAVLLGYLVLTTAYTFVLKRKMMVDVIVLACLYTIRVIGGCLAISVPISEWLLGFSMFIFMALALIKRYVELAARSDAALPDPTNRNYRNSDLSVVLALAAAAGCNAVTVFALYVSSDAVSHLYRHPKALWLICPVLLYWIGRALMMAHRRLMNDDPIIFALRDRTSLLCAGFIGMILLVAV